MKVPNETPTPGTPGEEIDTLRVTSVDTLLDTQPKQNSKAEQSRRQLVIGGVVLIFIIIILIIVAATTTGSNNNNNSNSDSSSTDDNDNNTNNSSSNNDTTSTSIINDDGSYIAGISSYNGYILMNQGLMEGNVLKEDRNDNSTWIYEFLGIRFAYPVDGDQRFRPAVLYNESWLNNTEDTDDAIYDATDYGFACPQVINPPLGEFLTGVASEDCLFLNLVTPFIPAQSRPELTSQERESMATTDENDLLPVMIWIHGGSFITGILFCVVSCLGVSLFSFSLLRQLIYVYSRVMC